jgi:hypothetical protein
VRYIFSATAGLTPSIAISALLFREPNILALSWMLLGALGIGFATFHTTMKLQLILSVAAAWLIAVITWISVSSSPASSVDFLLPGLVVWIVIWCPCICIVVQASRLAYKQTLRLLPRF